MKINKLNNLLKIVNLKHFNYLYLKYKDCSVMNEILNRVFNLIKKTGDKVVFYDSVKGEAYVMMKMEDYEKMTANAPTREDLTNFRAPDKIEKINQDIAMWREEFGNDTQNVPPEEGDETLEKKEEESQFYFEPVE